MDKDQSDAVITLSSGASVIRIHPERSVSSSAEKAAIEKQLLAISRDILRQTGSDRSVR